MKTCFSLVVWVLAVVGCSTQPTQVIVTVDAEPGVRAASSSVHLVVLGGASGEGRFDQVLGGRTFPFDVALAPLGGDVGRSWEVVVGAAGAEARAVGGYVEGETLFVSLVLEDVCRGVSCSSEETCRAGACVDARTGGTGDAGTPVDDAGDAGIPAGDAGTRDAGHDAGVVDLGTDASPGTDAGMLDAGSDSGTDAGTIDAGAACGTFQVGSWSITYMGWRAGCTATGPYPLVDPRTSLADLNRCPAGATACRHIDAPCTSFASWNADGNAFERQIDLDATGMFAAGTYFQSYAGSYVCQYTVRYERTGP